MDHQPHDPDQRDRAEAFDRLNPDFGLNGLTEFPESWAVVARFIEAERTLGDRVGYALNLEENYRAPRWGPAEPDPERDQASRLAAVRRRAAAAVRTTPAAARVATARTAGARTATGPRADPPRTVPRPRAGRPRAQRAGTLTATTSRHHPATSTRSSPMASDNHTSIVGNLAADPELRFTTSGAAVANLRVAVTSRVQDKDGTWRDGETSFYRVTAWRDLAINLVPELAPGSPEAVPVG